MEKVTGFGHFAINVKNWEKTLWFYGNLLKLPLSEPVDMGDFNLVYAIVPGGGKIELFQNRLPLEDRSQKDEHTFGFRHFAFIVSDLTSLREELVASGIKITLDITSLPKLGCQVLLCEDPNGVIIEFARHLNKS
ncbi:MAG: VOC family protein [Bacteroidota bacterium]